LFGILFDLEDGGVLFRRNVALSPNYTAKKEFMKFSACFFWFIAWHTLYPEDRGDMFRRIFGPPPNYTPKKESNKLVTSLCWFIAFLTLTP
jgi:hypothetical protein